MNGEARVTEATGTARARFEAARPAALAAAVCLLAASLVALPGCAGTSPDEFVEEPGVTVRIELTSGASMSGTLIGMEEGALVVDRSVPKSTGLEVVRRDGVDIVYFTARRSARPWRYVTSTCWCASVWISSR